MDMMETYKDCGVKTERQIGFWWLKVMVVPPVASSSYYCGGEGQGNTYFGR